jgi:hypothetical protein
MAITEVKISIRAYAAQINVDEKSIRKAISEGKIVKGYDAVAKKIIPRLANKEYGFKHVVPKSSPGISKVKLAEKLDTAIAKKQVTRNKVSPQTISNKAEALQALILNSEEDLISSIKITPDLAYAEATRLSMIMQLLLDKKKLEEMEDKLIRKEIVEKQLFAFGNELKKGLQAIPSRVADDILAAPNKVEVVNILSEEINNVLNAFARFAEVKLTNKNG